MSVPSVAISIVLPAYNEAERLPPYLAAIRPYCDCHYPNRYEVLVVDDGSTDALPTTLCATAADWPAMRTIRHAVNQGKGAAVRTGILAAVGELVLFADADGATPIDQEARLAEAIHSGADLAIGSRLLPSDGRCRTREFHRGLAGRGFAAVARWLLRLPVCDPQCGFKMFRADAARKIFSQVSEPRFLFDLEVLALAERLGLHLVEVPIDWREVPGGHFHALRELPSLVAELRRIRRRFH